jgi:hypothetical protein
MKFIGTVTIQVEDAGNRSLEGLHVSYRDVEPSMVLLIV